jgi:S1-C subfamily serine protease
VLSPIYSFKTILPIPNTPPSEAEAIYPANGQNKVDTAITLKWSSEDDDNDNLVFELLLDTISPPEDVVISDASTDSFDLLNLSCEMTYYWRINTTDTKDTSVSPIFSFSTREAILNNPPVRPDAIHPTGGQSNIDTSLTLKWESSDEDGDEIIYSIYFDTITPPVEIIANNLEVDSHTISGIEFGFTYYWRVVAYDGTDSTNSPIFSFSTREKAWDEIIPDLRKKCYIIGFEFEDHIYGMGSGFAISPKHIMTNAHVVNGLIERIENYGMEGITIAAVRDGGVINESFSFELDSFAIHPEYDTSTNYTYDFALLTVASGTIEDTVKYESAAKLLDLKVGVEVATIGFPGETNNLNTVQPIATYKSGTISALRPFNPDVVQASPETNVVIQHNFNTTGGTSGSPVFNKDGNVIAIHNSGAYKFIQTETGWTRIPVGSLGYSIRIDQRKTLLSTMRTAFTDIEPQIVYYTFINKTLTDMEMYLDGYLFDTIGWLDTLNLWDYKGAPVNDIIEFFSIVATNNWLYWKDTLVTGTNFYREYIVTDDLFLLGIRNSTNKTMKTCVVSNALGYDSSLVYLDIGSYTDVGYYAPSIYTDIRLYFYSALDYLFWEDIDTRSSTGYAAYIPLEATLTLSKRSNAQNLNKLKSLGKSETYYRKEYIKEKKSK